MKVDEFRKKLGKDIDNTDVVDLHYEPKISNDGKQFLIRLPRGLSEELEIQSGDVFVIDVKAEDIENREGKFKIEKNE